MESKMSEKEIRKNIEEIYADMSEREIKHSKLSQDLANKMIKIEKDTFSVSFLEEEFIHDEFLNLLITVSAMVVSSNINVLSLIYSEISTKEILDRFLEKLFRSLAIKEIKKDFPDAFKKDPS